LGGGGGVCVVGFPTVDGLLLGNWGEL